MSMQASRSFDRIPPRAAPRSHRDQADPEPSILGLYMREMAGHDLMSPDEELRAAEAIQRGRVELWRALLTYAPFVSAIASSIEEAIPDERRPQETLREIRAAARLVRDRQTRANKERFDGAVSALALAVAGIDTDGDLSDPIVSDLGRLVAGDRTPLTLRVTLPPIGSVPFARYASRVRHEAATLQAAKDRFVRANLRLVVTMARRFNHGRLPLADLIQEGNLGLLKAVDRFDPARGFRFSTYAGWWIRHAISRALADKGREVRVPVHMIDVHHRLERVRKSFAVTRGREPADEELAEQAGVSLVKVQRLRHCLLDRGPSLDMPVGSDDVRTMGELLVDESVPAALDVLADRRMEDKVREILGQLRPLEADVLRKRFGFDAEEPMTLREIGDEYSLSRERIRQVQEQALHKIRRELRRQQLM